MPEALLATEPVSVSPVFRVVSDILWNDNDEEEEETGISERESTWE